MFKITALIILLAEVCRGQSNSMEAYNSHLNGTSTLSDIQITTCVGSTMRASCPGNYLIKIKDVFFGRDPDSKQCTEDNRPVRLPYSQCRAIRASRYVTDMCSGLKECIFNVENLNFNNEPRSPCPRNNYLRLTFDCELPVYVEMACEGNKFHPSCMPGLTLQMQAAYGRGHSKVPRDACPVSGKDTRGRCASDRAQTLLSSLCDGREWCAIMPGDQYFGTLPSCTYTSKYVRAEFTCAKCENEHGDDSACDYWASQGQCQDNKQWMHAYCRKSCTKCGVRDQCLNIASDEDCYTWAFNGECHRNRDYMEAWCPRACNKCPEQKQVYKKTKPTPYIAPAKLTDGNQRRRACGKREVRLTCPTGQYIYVKDAFYGRREGNTCITGRGDGVQCASNASNEHALKVATRTCNGRNSCYLFADSPLPFTDPCPGANTTRYLELDFHCRGCDADKDTSCAFWASRGECGVNWRWMPDNCFQACGGCLVNERCSNKQKDSDCDYWASYGECGKNPMWMATNCKRSCKACTNDNSK